MAIPAYALWRLLAVIAIIAMTGLFVGCTAGETGADSAIDRGVDWLLAQQHEDGAWRSATYGQMRGGAANTALVVYALVHLPEHVRRRAQPSIDRAVVFLLSSLHEQGFVRSADGSSDYPTYATAMLLTALERMNVDKWKDERDRMRSYLVASQQATAAGRTEDDSDFGGWSQTGGDPREPSPRGRTNISVTSYALEALAASGGLTDDVREAALSFLSRCQHMPVDPRAARDAYLARLHDGGFFFTPRQGDPMNKAGAEEIGTEVWLARTYGSATADGLAALAACGVPADDARLGAAGAWLTKHDELRFVPGFTDADKRGIDVRGDGDPSMREGLRYYYLAGLARAARALSNDELAARLARVVVAMQQPDGSWRNPSNAMREDDPLIATALALAALGRSQSQ